MRLRWIAVALLLAKTVVAEETPTPDHDNHDASVTSDEQAQPLDPTLVTVAEGQLRGEESSSSGGKTFYSYRGVPYATPPLLQRRFERAVPAPAWEGVREALQDPPLCPQPPMTNFIRGGNDGIVGQEDCLYLNVFSPMKHVREGGQLLPVVVFLHGGAYVFGGTVGHGPQHLLNHDVVLVVVQYRLGTLGFLSTEDAEGPGNMGMLDQVLALQWVQKNVAEFGGSPLKVTLAGCSAGAFSTHLQVLSPASLGLFQRAVLMSGTALNTMALSDNHRQQAYTIAKTLQCDVHNNRTIPEECSEIKDAQECASCTVDRMTSREVLDCLKDKPYKEVVEAGFIFSRMGMMPLVMTPRVDGHFLMKAPEVLLKEGRTKRVDMLIGTTTHDGAASLLSILSSEGIRSGMRFNFAELGPISLGMDSREIAPLNQTVKIYDHYAGNINFDFDDIENLVKMFTDAIFWYWADLAATWHSSDPKMTQRPRGGDRRVYVYQYAHRAAISVCQPFPAAEVAEKWVCHGDDLVALFGNIFGGTADFSEEDRSVFDKFSSMIVAFATDGKPEWGDQDWPVYSAAEPAVMMLQTHAHVETPKLEERKFWRSLPLRANFALFPSEMKNVTFAPPETPATEEPTPESAKQEEDKPSQQTLGTTSKEAKDEL